MQIDTSFRIFVSNKLILRKKIQFCTLLRIVIKASCIPHIVHATTTHVSTAHVSTAHVTITHATTAHNAIVHDTITLATHSTYSITQDSRVTAHLWR
jgi:azurin